MESLDTQELQNGMHALSSDTNCGGKAKSSRSLPLFYDDEGELSTLGARVSQMECMPLRSPPGHYHYHVTDQTKSLQELQNEVGALLEFRDLVIETFPDLKHKMASSSASSTITGLPSSSLASRRTEWEPGIRVRRKLTQKENAEMSSSSLIRSRSNSHSGKKEPKSGEGNGSVIQDSGFSTETNSSKETHSASSTNGAMQGVNVSNTSQRMTIDSDNELWNLLDVLHKKSSRLRDEVEHLQQMEKERYKTSNIPHSFQKQLDRVGKEDVQLLRKERDRLLDKLVEMETKSVAERRKTTTLEDQINSLNLAKHELEEQLAVALNQKIELNSRIKDLHQQFEASKPRGNFMRNLTDAAIHKSTHHGASASATMALASKFASRGDGMFLGRLDGLVSTPNRLNKVRLADSKKIEAILLENNVVELQRHLLTLTVQNQVLQQKLDHATRSKIQFIKRLDKAKEDIDDLKFQLEEKNIEFEGTKAQLRVLESRSTLRLDGSPESSRPMFRLSPTRDSIIRQSQISTPSMKAMVPLAMDEIMQHSSSTESAQDQSEQNRALPETPKKRPSRIPLAGAKAAVNAAPKPPTGRSSSTSSSNTNNNGKSSPSGPPSNRSLNNKSISSLMGRSGPSSVKKEHNNSTSSLHRPESAQSWRKDSSLTATNRSSSIPISAKSSPSATKPLHSPLPKAKRDTVTAKTRNLDSLSTKASPATPVTASPTVMAPTIPPSSNISPHIYKSSSKKDLNSSYVASPQTRMKPSSVPVRRISSSGARNGDTQDYENGKSKLSISTERMAEKVANENEGDFRGSRDLIREYLMKTKVQQPPPIFQTPFETFTTNPMPNLDMVYRYHIVVDDDSSSGYREKNRDMEVKYYDDNYSIDLLHSQCKAEDESSNRMMDIEKLRLNESSVDVTSQENEHEVVKSGRIDSTCRLIGKVNPNILKTWEQLKGGNGTDGEKSQRIFYKTQRIPSTKQSSSIFYDSIETIVSDVDESTAPAAGEMMAECDSLLDKKHSNCWSIESEKNT